MVKTTFEQLFEHLKALPPQTDHELDAEAYKFICQQIDELWLAMQRNQDLAIQAFNS